mmetsp:Transcript_23999/g.64933  ORF Transcript_23999/g.64933 Transcript_23999/m.64933 type:complete len:204 (+) Transcript_23999:3578-4189(+)
MAISVVRQVIVADTVLTSVVISATLAVGRRRGPAAHIGGVACHLSERGRRICVVGHRRRWIPCRPVGTISARVHYRHSVGSAERDRHPRRGLWHASRRTVGHRPRRHLSRTPPSSPLALPLDPLLLIPTPVPSVLVLMLLRHLRWVLVCLDEALRDLRIARVRRTRRRLRPVEAVRSVAVALAGDSRSRRLAIHVRHRAAVER